MPRFIPKHRILLVLGGLALAALMAATPAICTLATAAEEKKPTEGAKEGEGGGNAEAATPQYTPGPPLNGRFDMSILRSGVRVTSYRYSLPKINITLACGAHHAAQVRLNLVLEFGSEAGMAETKNHESGLQSELTDLLGHFDTQQLLKTSGKMQLKDAVVRLFNTRLRTAQVRQVYITEFIVQS
jgi:flagellar basal body-associated protein FliL